MPLTNDGAGSLPVILLSVPPSELPVLFPARTRELLGELASDLRIISPAELHDRSVFAETMRDIDIAIVAWGFPRLDAERLASAPRLRLVMNAASSVRALVSEELWARRIPVSQAGDAMAPAVAELSLTMTLALLRRVGRMDHALRTGRDWETARAIPRAREISGARIGVVGASRTGRRYIDLVRALGAEVLVSDPYVPSDDPLHAAVTPLDELVERCDVIALHAPATAETTSLLNAERIAAMRPGTAVINTARASLVDDDALYAAAKAVTIDVALDVYDPEPVPTADRWRELPNAILTGHVGGATVQSRERAGLIAVDEVRRYVNAQPLAHEVTRADLERRG